MRIDAKASHREGYGSHRCVLRLAAACLVLAVLPCAAAGTAFTGKLSDTLSGTLSDIDYRLGEGLHIPGVGLNLGGYATGTYERLRGLPDRAALDNLSLSLWWEGTGRWKVFSEFDYENAISSRSAHDKDEDRYLALERIYVDYALSETTTVRAGKFLTPIGRWNLLHAAPLVWTTSRPLVTTVAFPTNVTGLMVSSDLTVAGTTIDYSVFGSRGDEVRPNPALDPFNDAIGFRAVAPLPVGGQLGFSYVTFEQAHAEGLRKELFGLDLLWVRNRFELSAEAVYRVLHSAGLRNEGGGFVQLVAPLADRLFGVARFESYRQAQQSRATELWVAGISYRMTPAVVLKAEWVGARHNDLRAPEGFLSSVSVLF
ncbi:hypothetical protein BH11PSE8_BH11PSE8_27840 [soil metagenome]